MRLPSVADEVKYFARSAIFAVVVGIVYWIWSYEWAGTVLLIAFGLAAAFATAILFAGARGAQRGAAGGSQAGHVGPDVRPDGPFGDESGRLPAPSLAPLFVGLGAATAALSLAFGIWFVFLGLVFLLPGVVSWLSAAERELHAVSGDVRPAPSTTADLADRPSNASPPASAEPDSQGS